MTATEDSVECNQRSIHINHDVDTATTSTAATTSSSSVASAVEETVEDNDEFVLVNDQENDDVGMPLDAAAQTLQAACPLATMDECRRFSKAFKKAAEARSNLTAYMEWKQAHKLLNDESGATSALPNDNDDIAFPEPAENGNDYNERYDGALWKYCMTKAHRHHHSHKAAPSNATLLPDGEVHANNDALILDEPLLLTPMQNDECTNEYMTCRDGHGVVYMLPARMTPAGIAELDTYTTALTLYLYHAVVAKQQHNSNNGTSGNNKLVTVIVDVRAGRGWPNVMVYNMYGIIKHAVGVLRRFFPGSVHQVVVVPIPTLACWAYKAISPFLDADLKRCMILVAGPSTAYSALLPTHQSALQDVLSSENLQLLEALRQAAFV